MENKSVPFLVSFLHFLHTGFLFGLGFNPDARLIHGGFGRHGACSAYGQLCQ